MVVYWAGIRSMVRLAANPAILGGQSKRSRVWTPLLEVCNGFSSLTDALNLIALTISSYGCCLLKIICKLSLYIKAIRWVSFIWIAKVLSSFVTWSWVLTLMNQWHLLVIRSIISRQSTALWIPGLAPVIIAAALVSLESRTVGTLVFVIFFVICLIESIISEVGVLLAYKSNALGFDGYSEILTQTPNS